jgi:hypothetical protein
MEVKATVIPYAPDHTPVEMPLTQEMQDQLAWIFELGANVPPNTPQVLIAVIKTPGYEEKG